MSILYLENYNPAWPEAFEQLHGALGSALGRLAQAIEHVGSTAVPGLAAKPIIDVDVVLASEQRLLEAIRALAPVGYTYQGELGIAGRHSFGRLGEDVPRDGSHRQWPEHHLYLCAQGCPELQRHLAFRDYLRGHPATAAQYERLKRELMQRSPRDREAYTLGKSEFVEQVLKLAAVPLAVGG
jgi:GrpB-like predicted nucleotidyltransferase (UPF0157 family)